MLVAVLVTVVLAVVLAVLETEELAVLLAVLLAVELALLVGELVADELAVLVGEVLVVAVVVAEDEAVVLGVDVAEEEPVEVCVLVAVLVTVVVGDVMSHDRNSPSCHRSTASLRLSRSWSALATMAPAPEQPNVPGVSSIVKASSNALMAPAASPHSAAVENLSVYTLSPEVEAHCSQKVHVVLVKGMLRPQGASIKLIMRVWS